MQTQHMPRSVFHNSVVVFSKNYLPLTRVDLKRAIALLATGKAVCLDNIDAINTHSWTVRSPSLVLTVPTCIRLTGTSTERMWKVPPVSRREVMRRDRHACQYCGSTRNLTLDHVQPRSRGGAHTWDNVVAACAPCNSRKGARTPAEAGMPLFRKPKAPMHPALAFAEKFWKTRPAAPPIAE
ncbi:restriction endonuclease [Rubidibacter lacunae KORDI 51-2]|uniref:Restriction endonuclease n=1 Tax=Rubidibacter lacunae KORDI 51-2 TaxID=582515 RepID=U5DG14_9CHRO|nr:HNH endonuclease [Rubidibacter lacunae]ERN40536.1 restriction endonuclease [Rubidibacter lacunae KORDI 51-2]